MSSLQHPSILATNTTLSSEFSVDSSRVQNQSFRDPKVLRIFYDGFAKIVIAISTLGVGFTFSFILTDVYPPNATLRPDQIRFFMTMTWLLFLVALAFAIHVQLLVNFFGNYVVQNWKQHRGWPVAVLVI